MLEAMAASGIMAAMLAPTLVAMRHAMEQSEETATRRFLLHFAVLQLEESCAAEMAFWDSVANVAVVGVSHDRSFKVQAVASDNAIDGGIPGLLKRVRVTAWSDGNGNDVPDAGELQVELVTKVARMESYANP